MIAVTSCLLVSVGIRCLKLLQTFFFMLSLDKVASNNEIAGRQIWHFLELNVKVLSLVTCRCHHGYSTLIS